MKILFSGYHNPNFITITEYIERAIENLGHELFIFDDRQHIVPGRVRRRIGWLNTLDLNHINNKLISLVYEAKPDLTIVTGGHRITSRTLSTLKEIGTCTILWTIDAPFNFQPIIDVAPFYDYIFCQGTEAIELLDQKGIKGVNWLPMACDPAVHRPVKLSTLEKERYGSDVVFVGSYYPNRAVLFENLSDFDLGIWGPGWDKLGSKTRLRKRVKATHTKPVEWVKIYSASKIILSIHYQAPENKFPMYQASPRVFEALACGAFVISDNQKDVFSLLKDGNHLARFDSPDDIVEKITYYLDHSEYRQQIASRGRKEVLSAHTYEDRVKKLLSFVRR